MNKGHFARSLLIGTLLMNCAKPPSRSPGSHTKAISNTPVGTNPAASSTDLKSSDSTVPASQSPQTTPGNPGASNGPAGSDVTMTTTDQAPTPGSAPAGEPLVVVSDAEMATIPSSPGSTPPPASDPPAPVPPPAQPPSFQKGDVFNPKTYKVSQMVSALIEGNKYLETKATKAIAVNEKGLGMAVVLSTQASLADAKRAALEGCYVIGGFQPCTVLVADDKYEKDSASLSKPETYTDTLATPKVLTEVPFKDPSQGDLMITQYQKFLGFKAIAISLDGTKVAVIEDDLESIDEAKRLALERCELKAKLIPCFLFAINDDITFAPKGKPWNLSIKFDALDIETKGVQVPGISVSQLDNLVDGILTYTDRVEREATGNGMVYLSTVSGNVGWSTPSHNLITGKDYKASAKERCEAFDGPETCSPVIDKLKVSLTAAQLPSSTNGYYVAHCKAMPRVSCDAHKAAGCKESGNYYIVDADFKVDLKPCTL